jgi:hypothetical protein
MRYLIIKTGHAPFYSHWLDSENNFAEGITVIDLFDQVYTVDGVNWIDIEFNRL